MRRSEIVGVLYVTVKFLEMYSGSVMCYRSLIDSGMLDEINQKVNRQIVSIGFRRI